MVSVSCDRSKKLDLSACWSIRSRMLYKWILFQEDMVLTDLIDQKQRNFYIIDLDPILKVSLSENQVNWSFSRWFILQLIFTTVVSFIQISKNSITLPETSINLIFAHIIFREPPKWGQGEWSTICTKY